jgi:hypothetical protein
MLMETNRNIQKINYSENHISYYQYQILLLNYYLRQTFESVTKSINQCENLIDLFYKQAKINMESSYYSDSLSTDEKSEDIFELFKDIYCHKKIGKYHWKIRAMKIIKYKVKQIIRKKKIPIITKFSGRSKIAILKPRSHGRFIKKN